MTNEKERQIDKKRATPGTKGGGRYFRIVVRPTNQFVTFRTQDVGRRGGIQRISGRRSSGTWATQAWLINKHLAHVSNNKLVPDRPAAKDLLNILGSEPTHEKGDVFTARERSDAPGAKKQTATQKRTQNK